jgi:hypothetical protein
VIDRSHRRRPHHDLWKKYCLIYEQFTTTVHVSSIMDNINDDNAAADAANNNKNKSAVVVVSHTPPGLTDMFITSTDSLRHRTINQKLPPTWKDRPPLFEMNIPSSYSRLPSLWRKPPPPEENVTERQEDPNLLKGVSLYYCNTILSLVQRTQSFSFAIMHSWGSLLLRVTDDPTRDSTIIAMCCMDVQYCAG